ncbi:MAG: hypothetical protein A2008_02135 [Candidatus Wallbacteria bacterium GWC2_49_35]|uniref:Uncharacterized protein n=1 Tax=Candidatus Wallbacteria bacterium GWC2_49_35 TaxID=1817813 RepID=A0A1F7WQA0_9BACT|nr:MAG: hypothetical protein A2008_02135 [Candidatus Wallbacteria bacterium GWC2_49_35]
MPIIYEGLTARAAAPGGEASHPMNPAGMAEFFVSHRTGEYAVTKISENNKQTIYKALIFVI